MTLPETKQRAHVDALDGLDRLRALLASMSIPTDAAKAQDGLRSIYDLLAENERMEKALIELLDQATHSFLNDPANEPAAKAIAAARAALSEQEGK